MNFLLELGHNKWDVRFMNRAILTSSWSKDPREKVGCILVDTLRNELSGGYNGFPRGIKDDERLNDREIKNRMVVHAEANAVAAAARNGHRLAGAVCYVNRHPCMQCASLLIQAGIFRVVYYHPDILQSSYLNEFTMAKNLLREAGVDIEAIKLE